ncbi:MAG: hypothetical protein GTO45_14505 [Candidatus Aminicenantes bacterium]|nr:hypothetical protein [Candidatus Aminicenantes bacterium]NIM79978.1 hypothetical protein [Candidatus Aminicenantes bacterium]NIN19317.1 hypothetical protein [Candidatus Aminicenantes bacterium]NIN43220.1 hypothetical protein [Candidatus Aminicenantes bacterium]NIN85959.1 hypothetical protein [Candidatus Aminicenantes bacterium]
MRLAAIIFQKTFPRVLLAILVVSFILVFDCCKPGKESQVPQEEQEEEVMIEIPLSTTTNNEEFCQLNQSVATLADGRFGVVWEVGSFPQRDVALQMITRYGTLCFEPGGKLIANTRSDEGDAVIVAHPFSGVFVAFSQKNGNGGRRILVQYFNDTGEPMWPGDGIVAADAVQREAQSKPTLVPDSSGGVYVCFDPSGNWDDEVKCQHLDAYGNRLWGDLGKTAGGEAGLKVFPRAIRDGTGGLLVFWRNQRNVFVDPNQPMIMEGQHFSADGTKLWGERGKTVKITNLAASNGYTFRFMGVVPDINSGAVIVFNDWTQQTDAELDVVAQRVADDGSLLWGEGTVVTGDWGHQQLDAIIAADDGGVFVVVSDQLNESENILRIYRLGPDGQHRWGTEGVRLSHPTDLSLDYGLSGNFDSLSNRLRLVWTRLKDSASYDFDVMAARFTGDGQSLDTPGGITLISAQDAQFTIAMVYSQAAGLWLAVWDDRRKSQSWDDLDVYAALVNDAFLDNQPPLFTGYQENAGSVNTNKKRITPGNVPVLNGLLHTRLFRLPNQAPPRLRCPQRN